MLNSTKLHQNDTLSSSISNSSSSSVENNTNLQQNGALTTQTNLKNYLIEKLLNEDESKPVKVDTFLNKSESKEDLISETGTYTIEEKVNSIDKKDDNTAKNNTDYNLVKSIDLMSARAAIDETFGIVERPHISNEDNDDSELNKSQQSKRPAQKIVRERNKTYSLTQDLLANLNKQEEHAIDLDDPSCNTNSLTKTTTYDVIANNKEIAGSFESIDLDVTRASQVSKSTKSGVDTELLLGNTEQLIETIKKRRSDKKLQLKQRLTIANNTMENVSKHTLSPSPSSSCSSSIADNKSSNELRSWTISTSDLKSDKPEDKSLETSRASVKNRNNRNSCSDLDGNISDSSNHTQSQKKGGMAFDYILDGDKKLNYPVNKSQTQRLTSANLSRHRSVARSTNLSNDANSSYNSSKNTNKTSNTSSTQRPLTSSRSSNQSVNRNYNRRSSRDDYERSSVTISSSGYTTPKNSAVSLGAKIKSKATDSNVNSPAQGGNTPRSSVRRRASDNSLQPTKSSYSSVTSSNNSTVSPYTNRTLYLRQQSSKAKRESLDSNNNSPYGSNIYYDPSVKTKPLNGILKKTTSSVAPNNRISQKQYQPTSKQPSRSNSRATSPAGSHNLHLQAHQSPLMTSSLNLPSGSALPSSAEPRGSFQRRKNYDPIKAVEQEKQKKLQMKQEAANNNNNSQKLTNSVCNLQQSLSKNSIYSTENDSYQSNNLDYDSMSDSSQSFSIPVQSLKANISDKQSYEKILQSTLQRLCIRLIQMSTGVLDKIGDENSTEANLFNSGENTELERMQQLAKLVHSMQLVHDHIQIIDSSLFTAKPEEAYMKELSKIRAEVECLKQNVANSTSSSIVSNVI